MRNSALGLIAALVGATLASRCLAQPEGVLGYEVTDCDPDRRYLYTFATELSDNGIILMGTMSFGISFEHAIWRNGTIYRLPLPPGCTSASASEISPNGRFIPIEPWCIDSTRNNDIAVYVVDQGRFIWYPGPDQQSDTQIGAINNLGQISGIAYPPNSISFWNTPDDLRNLGEGTTSLDLNENGAFPFRGTNASIMFFDGSTIQVEPPFDEEAGSAYGLNDLNDFVGELDREGPFVHSNGVTTILSQPTNCKGIGTACEINDSGVIVGYAGDPECNHLDAYVWDASGQGSDLNNVVQHNRIPGLMLRYACNINEAGQIAVSGEDSQGCTRAVVLTPYQFSLSSISPGIAGQINTVTVSGLIHGQRIRLAYGFGTGAQIINNDCTGALMMIQNIRGSLPGLNADASGTATFEFFVPASAAGKTIRIQAFSASTCEISHSVDWTF